MGLTEAAAHKLYRACKDDLLAPEMDRWPLTLCSLYFTDMLAMPIHRVFVTRFVIDRYEVSESAYQACVQAGSCDPIPVNATQRRPEEPVTDVTWENAERYCEWKHGRLPTEAEWERSAKGADDRNWPWGMVERTGDFNHGRAMSARERQPGSSRFLRGVPVDFVGAGDPGDGFNQVAPVGSYIWSEGPFGTYDQSGNVAEWTLDALGTSPDTQGFKGLPVFDPCRRSIVSDSPHVVRGGSWRQPAYLAAVGVRDPYDWAYGKDFRGDYVGFRCVYEGADL